jgi:hypothetical protein
MTVKTYTASGGNVTISGEATDAAGDIFLVGSLDGTATIDGGSISSTAGTAGSGFVAKINANGSLAWTQLLGGNTGDPSYQDSGESIAVSADGSNVYVGAQYIGTLDLPGGGTMVAPNTDYYGALLDLNGSTGSTIWHMQIGSNPGGGETVSSIGVDGNGNVYATGGMYDENPQTAKAAADLIIDGTGKTISTITSTTSDVGKGLYVLKANATTGAVAWASPVNTGAGDLNGSAIAVDGSGHLYMVGQLYIDQFGASGGNVGQAAGYNFGAFLVSVNETTGAFGTPDVFSAPNITVGGKTEAAPVNISSVAIDSSGDPIVAGSFGDAAKLTPGSSTEQTGLRTALSPSGSNLYAETRAFVEKFDTSLKSQWLATESGAQGSAFAEDYASGVAVSASGTVSVVGLLNGNDGGTSQFGSTSINSPGSEYEGFLWTLSDSAGATTDAGAFTTTGNTSYYPIAPSDVSLANGDLLVGINATTTTNVNPLGSPDNVSPGASSGFIVADVPPPCYCRGTRIETARGEVAVEDLRVGDLVVTASGALRPIVWLGHRRLDISRHPAPREVCPVRVAADAFGDDLPRRDLWLSPGHNIAREGVIMPICTLINGQSVAQVGRPQVDYWHVELDAHDIILAEGLPAESFLDCGNRTGFANGGDFVEAHPDFKAKHWAETCLPLVKDGPQVAATKKRLIERLQEQGGGISREAEAHIVADRQKIEPVRLSETRLAFALPACAKNITLRSKVFVPAYADPECTDIRELGLCVARLQIDGEDVALDQNDVLVEGWHDAEYENGAVARRWTKGNAVLPASVRYVIVDLGGFGRYWRDPNDNVVALFG